MITEEVIIRKWTSLQNVDWDALFSDYNVNEKWAIFKELLDNAVSKCVPKRKRRTRQKMVDKRPGRKSKQCGISMKIQRTAILSTAMQWT